MALLGNCHSKFIEDFAKQFDARIFPTHCEVLYKVNAQQNMPHHTVPKYPRILDDGAFWVVAVFLLAVSLTMSAAIQTSFV